MSADLRQRILNLLPTAIRQPLNDLFASGAELVVSIVGNVTGNVTGNLTGNVTGTITGNADTATVAATSTLADTTDESCSVVLAEDATGNKALKTDAGLTYNASTGMLTATGLTGPLTGKASTAGAADTAAKVPLLDTTDSSCYVVLAPDATGDQALKTDAGLTYDASSGILTATGLAGPLTGNVTGNASGSSGSCTGNAATASKVPLLDTTDTTCSVVLVEDATGDQALKSDSGLTYDASTGILTATGLAGPLTGNVTGNTSGSSGSCTGNALTASGLSNSTAPTKAVAAIGIVTISGDVIDGETVTVGTETFEFDTEAVANITPGNTRVNVSAGTENPATATLTISDNATNDVLDTETVTIDGEVYEFDWNGAVTGGNTAVDISAKLSLAKAQGSITTVTCPNEGDTLEIRGVTYTFKKDNSTGAAVIDLRLASCPTMSALATGSFTFNAETFRPAIGTLTVTAQPVHNETVVLEGTTYTVKTDGTTAGDTLAIYGTTCPTMVRASGKIGFLSVPANGQLITIDGRTYSFDDAAKTGDVKVDRTLCTSTDACLTQLAASIAGDGSATVTSSTDLPNDEMTITAIKWGVDGNVAVSDNCTDGGWKADSLSGGKLTGHVAATVAEVFAVIEAKLGASSTNTNITYASPAVTVTAKVYGTAGNAIIFTDTATGIACTGAGTLGGVGATQAGTDMHDDDTITIGGRVYGLDSAGDGTAGDTVTIDLSTATTFAAMMTLIQNGVNADASRLADVAAAGTVLTATSRIYGAEGNYAIAESITHGTVSGAAMTGGVDATGTEILARITAVVEANDTLVTIDAKDADEVYVNAVGFGTMGNAYTLVADGVRTTVSGAVLSGGADCSKEDAAAAFISEYNTHTAKALTASSGGAGIVTITADVPGTAMNGKVCTETMSQGAWGGNTAGGLDVPKAEALAAIVALTPTADVTWGVGGDVLTITSKTKGVIGNAIALAETGANMTKSGAFLGTGAGSTAGVDGTVATKGTVIFDASYIYVASDICTISADNWRKATLATL